MPLEHGSSREAISHPEMRRDVPIERLLDMCAKSQVRDVEITCRICNTKFMAPRHRATTAKYCGRECYNISLRGRGGVILNCDVCGKEYRRSPSHAHYETKTCSIKCRGIAIRAKKPSSNDYPSTRRWMLRQGLVTQCARCGYDDVPAILVIHHKDRNRINNELDNLEVLCPNCHAIEHYAENKNGWAHNSTSRKAQNRKNSNASRAREIAGSGTA